MPKLGIKDALEVVENVSKNIDTLCEGKVIEFDEGPIESVVNITFKKAKTMEVMNEALVMLRQRGYGGVIALWEEAQRGFTKKVYRKWEKMQHLLDVMDECMPERDDSPDTSEE